MSAARTKRSARVPRRRLLVGAGSLVGAAWASRAGAGPVVQERATAGSSVTGRLARYLVTARDRDLPRDVLEATRHRILDTLGAIVSGARLKPGQMAIQFVRTQGGVAEASVLTTDIQTTAINAAFANGMFAHADETDDFEPVTKAHPGCAVVPAALAMAERLDRSGAELVRAVAIGYDVGCRFLLAVGPDALRASHRSAEGISATFGAAAAASALARLDETATSYALSYAAQQASGVWSWERDTEHVEKAFDFAGMGARNGVAAAIMAAAGFSGVPDVFDGEHNVLQAFSLRPQPEELVAGLGGRFFTTESAIKVFSVGYPIQAALDAFFALQREHRLTVDNVERVVVHLPEDGARIVDDRSMPDVNCQYAIAVSLLEGRLSFEDSHSYERMKDPRVLAVKSRVRLVGDRELMDPASPRSARVEVTLRDGRTVNRFTRHPPGTKENPLDTARVNAKASELMTGVLGRDRTAALVDRINTLESLSRIRDLRPLVAGTAATGVR